jgi:hypothetical protein
MDAAVLQTDTNGQMQYVIGPENIHYDLHLVAPNYLVGRGLVEGKQVSLSSFTDGGSQFRISLVKLPAPAVGP